MVESQERPYAFGADEGNTLGVPSVTVRPPSGAGAGEVVLAAPPSKSHALRALTAAAVCGGGSLLGLSLPWPDDVRFFVSALEQLGVPVTVLEDGVSIDGPMPRGGDPVTLNAGEGAAPARFLLALGALAERPVTVTGGGRLSARPMTPLLDALGALGATVDGGPGLPATVRGPLRGDRTISVDGRVSSQFLSALLLIAPAIHGHVAFRTVGAQVSRPYLDLTRGVMSEAGVVVGDDLVVPESGAYERSVFHVEADWSGATALLAAAPFLGRPVRVPSLNPNSHQPDRLFASHLSGLGIHVSACGTDGVRVEGAVTCGGIFDLSDCPDAAPALAAVGALASEPVRVTGAAHLRHKESDRIAVLVHILRAAGVDAEAFDDGFEVTGPLAAARGDPVPLSVHADHRMAMAGALLGLRRPVFIDDAACVAKSFPRFFDQWPSGIEWGPPG